jgi:predicted protein tyrosine phosphatase
MTMAAGVARRRDTIHVCSLASVHDVIKASEVRHIVTCLADESFGETPAVIMEGRHLKLLMHDIEAELDGCVLPNASHVGDLIAFVKAWDRQAPMLIHCFAGISRSTAAAFIALCTLNPNTPENVLARELRKASPSATPNRRLVALGDDALGRAGRMIRAAEEIGRGQFELAAPFHVPASFE